MLMKKYLEWDSLFEHEQAKYVDRAVYLIDNGYMDDADEYALAKRIYEARHKKVKKVTNIDTF